jgi:allophanate hydrolase subunit 2
VGQSSPGTKTRFHPVSIDEALDARRKYMDRQRKLIQLW